jgi:hypothetical protein
MVNCVDLLVLFAQNVDTCNNTLIDNMTNSDTSYQNVCVLNNITYTNYFNQLKSMWENTANGLHTNCDLTKIMFGGGEPAIGDQNVTALLDRISDNDVGNIINILSKMKGYKLDVDIDAVTTFVGIANFMLIKCSCNIHSMLSSLLNMYSTKLVDKFVDKAQFKKHLQEMITSLKQFVENIKQFNYQDMNPNGVNDENLQGGKADLNVSHMKQISKDMIMDISNKFTELYSISGISVESELQQLIPDSLGDMKKFFIIIISTYYENLHPIIWAQIYKKSIDEFGDFLPMSKDEWFQYFSRQLLLNSGPFILKILQMIRPVLTPELATKYNLTKLKYPLMTNHQVDMIFNKIIINRNEYTVVKQFSASVGHVCLVQHNKNPSKPFIVKIIKPLSIAQSCWEYKTLSNVFLENSCEDKFVRNMLESNGSEFNVYNEIQNIKKGIDYYTCDYNEIYGLNVDAKLTAVSTVPNIIKQNCWYAMTMTLAPGVPVSYLVENNKLINDTAYRAKLHRCFDLLVMKFFFSIFKYGFYHGDLHAGNIFFSFQQSQMTLIDFGAVGELDVFSVDSTPLLSIIIMSIFYNFDGILDLMTDVLFQKCVKTDDDKNAFKQSPKYIAVKETLIQYKNHNIKHQEKNKKYSRLYNDNIFSDDRIAVEKEKVQSGGFSIFNLNKEEDESIYKFLNINPLSEEDISQNDNMLPNPNPIKQLDPSEKSIPFVKVLGDIIKFYAEEGINIPIKFNEFNEFQKAYALLLGVLNNCGYDSARVGFAIKTAIMNKKNIPNIITKPKWAFNMVKFYSAQHSLYKKHIESSL